jgi:hypothetical protein
MEAVLQECGSVFCVCVYCVTAPQLTVRVYDAVCAAAAATSQRCCPQFALCAGCAHACRAGRNFGRTFGSNMASQAMYLNLERLGAQVGLQCIMPLMLHIGMQLLDGQAAPQCLQWQVTTRCLGMHNCCTQQHSCDQHWYGCAATPPHQRLSKKSPWSPG